MLPHLRWRVLPHDWNNCNYSHIDSEVFQNKHLWRVVVALILHRQAEIGTQQHRGYIMMKTITEELVVTFVRPQNNVRTLSSVKLYKRITSGNMKERNSSDIYTNRKKGHRTDLYQQLGSCLTRAAFLWDRRK